MPSSRRTPRRREPPRADMESAPTTNGGRAANRETANSALHQTPVGDDARIVPGEFTPPQGLREGHGPPLQTAANRPTGMAPPTRAAVGGRCSHRPGHLTPRERPRADMESAPTTNGGRAACRGNRCPCVIINLCRGRCSHRPGNLTPRERPRAGCPHPYRKFCRREPRGRIWNPPLQPTAGARPTGKPHPAPPRTPVGDDARIVPYNQRRARRPTGKPCPCVIINPCRGRCSHRPANLRGRMAPCPIRAK